MGTTGGPRDTRGMSPDKVHMSRKVKRLIRRTQAGAQKHQERHAAVALFLGDSETRRVTKAIPRGSLGTHPQEVPRDPYMKNT